MVDETDTFSHSSSEMSEGRPSMARFILAVFAYLRIVPLAAGGGDMVSLETREAV